MWEKWKPNFEHITLSPKDWDRIIARPWLYPRVKPTINFRDMQIEKMPDGSVLAHTDLDEEAIVKAWKEKEH